MPLNWNALTPYLTPLSGHFQTGVRDAVRNTRTKEALAENKRQFEAGQPYRDIQRKQVEANLAKQEYLRLLGGIGPPFETPKNPNDILKNPFAKTYLGIKPEASPKGSWQTTIQNGTPVRQFIIPTPGQTIPFYEKSPDKSPKGSWQTTIENGKPVRKFIVPTAGQTIPYYEKSAGSGGQYTPQQLVDDTRAYYTDLFRRKTKAMVDPLTGIPLKEFRGQYNDILNEIQVAAQNDYYRINQGTKPSWLTGSTDPEQAQTRYNQLRSQGYPPAQIAEQLRAEGFNIQ